MKSVNPNKSPLVRPTAQDQMISDALKAKNIEVMKAMAPEKILILQLDATYTAQYITADPDDTNKAIMHKTQFTVGVMSKMKESIEANAKTDGEGS